MTHALQSASPGLSAILQRYWGFDTLRPLQEAAIRCGIEGRDSLVVMPTGGGKSLCFQVPPLVTGRLTVVVSPLIALMKDQVDALRLSGVPAGALHSQTPSDEARETFRLLGSGELRLLYVAPERLFMEGFIAQLAHAGVASFAIDEAHCISQWGHDFRPEYRRLASLREKFPHASLHAFTATATPRVREDIAAQLKLRGHELLVGCFDRPNLTYRVVPRADHMGQIEEAVRRHAGHAVIVYCISRRHTEAVADELVRRKIYARAYHAGLAPLARTQVQDQFAQERVNVVVATVAFGMGIDRSDVRCVIHAEHPKSIEAYQQETGRAGRDGLPSECLLLYSAADVQKWEGLIERSAAESETPVSREWVTQQIQHLRSMQQYCTSGRCRHELLSAYFGQVYEPPFRAAGEPAGCGACDVCLGEVESIPDQQAVAQKIVSCVARIAMTTGHSGAPLEFGAAHIAGVLRGRTTKAILERGHDRLSTFGLLPVMSAQVIGSCINQLIDQGFLRRSAGMYATIGLGERARELLKGDASASLVRARISAVQDDESDPAQRELFELLRGVRRALAQDRAVPAYLILGDRTLDQMAAARPTTADSLIRISGVGEKKCSEFGERFLGVIREFCVARGLPTDRDGASGAQSPRRAKGPSSKARRSFEHFARGASIEEVAAIVGVATSTAAGYLDVFIQETKPRDVSAWLSPADYETIIAAAAKTGADQLSPIFEFLGGKYLYPQIRVALTHHRVIKSDG